MEKFDIYKDVAKRTGGDIYLGVVGPVRTGKSTLISKFVELLVAPNIQNKNKQQIAIDELPQSGVGKTITTVEPKFTPSEAVKINLKNKTYAKIRLIDCVGFLVDGAIGDKENDEPRLLKTPWSANPMPFEKAATIGTEKVIKDHSTIGIVVTTDGSICDIPRQNYIQAEEKVVNKLKSCGKPFIIVLNTVNENDTKTLKLASELTDKYGVTVIPMNVKLADESSIQKVMESALMEFPVKRIDIKMPKWMQVLPRTSEIITKITETVKETSTAICKMKQHSIMETALLGVEGVKTCKELRLETGEGKIVYEIEPESELFYKIISELSNEQITDEFKLMSYVKELKTAKDNYRKLKNALSEVEGGGYGIVIPCENDMSLGEPEVVKRGARYGVKLKAKTSCLHLIKVDVDAEVSPISGTEKQCKDFAEFLKKEYDENPQKVWQTDIFGKPLSSLVGEEIVGKIDCMKDSTKQKMKKTVTKLVNDGRGRLICIIY